MAYFLLKLSGIAGLMISLVLAINCGNTQIAKESQALNEHQAAESIAKGNSEGPIWKGEINSIQLEWTTEDLIAKFPRGEKKLFSTWAARDAKLDDRIEKAVSESNLDLDITLLSVVGNLISIQYKRSYFSRMGPTTSNGQDFSVFTVDLEKEVKADSRIKNNYLSGYSDSEQIALSSYFDRGEILHGLLADEKIRDAVLEKGNGHIPRTLDDFEKLTNHSLLFNNYYFVIYPGFLTAFNFEETEGEKVKVRMPFRLYQSRNNEVSYDIFFWLTIPDNLRDDFKQASEKTKGFLRKDADTLFGGKSTRIEINKKLI